MLKRLFKRWFKPTRGNAFNEWHNYKASSMLMHDAANRALKTGTIQKTAETETELEHLHHTD